jgi:hypothetical protein
MSPELQRIMKDQLSAFKKKFGRDPGPNDPVFFDPDAKTPQLISEAKLRRLLTEVAEEAGLNPDHVLAALGYQK